MTVSLAVWLNCWLTIFLMSIASPAFCASPFSTMPTPVSIFSAFFLVPVWQALLKKYRTAMQAGSTAYPWSSKQLRPSAARLLSFQFWDLFASLFFLRFFKFYFIVVRTQNEMCLLKFLNVQYIILDSRYSVVEQISRAYASCMWRLYAHWLATPHFPLFPAPGK